MKQYGKVLSHIEELQKQLTEQEKAHPLPKEWNLKEAIHENNTIHRFHRLADKGKEPQLEDWTELSEITEQYADSAASSIRTVFFRNVTRTSACLSKCASTRQKSPFSSGLLHKPSPTVASACSAKSLVNKAERRISMSISERWSNDAVQSDGSRKNRLNSLSKFGVNKSLPIAWRISSIVQKRPPSSSS